MNLDLTELLDDWPYESGQINVRLIEGDDGLPRIQVRLDLGLLQMHAEGRPDGARPQGHGSLLEYHESRIDQSDTDPEAEPVRLTSDECRALREEAAQYYHRYVALLVLDDYAGVVRDTTRNLRVLDLCREHAAEDSDKSALEQFRAYIMMMRARAIASQALGDNEPKAAMNAIEEGLDALKSYFDAQGAPEMFDQSPEAEMLRGMREALVPKLPVSQKSELRQRLAQALTQENYELAAILRDELKSLPE